MLCYTFIIHWTKFKWLWQPIGKVQVSWWNLTSIPPRWTNGVTNQPKQSQIVVWKWFRWHGVIITHFNVWVWKNRWVIGSRWHQMHQIIQNWTNSPYSTLGQQKCPNSMNASTPAMMMKHNWIIDWVGALMWVWIHQFSRLLVQLSTLSPKP